MLANTELIVAIALPVLLLLILSAILCFRYFQRHTVADVESGSIASSSAQLVQPASTSSYTLNSLATSTRDDGLRPPGSVSLSQAPGTLAQPEINVMILPPILAESLGGSSTDLMVEKRRRHFHINPELQVNGERVRTDIEMESTCMEHPSKESTLSGITAYKTVYGVNYGAHRRLELGRVAKIFCHKDVFPSIQSCLEVMGVDMVRLKNENWIEEIKGTYIKLYNDSLSKIPPDVISVPEASLPTAGKGKFEAMFKLTWHRCWRVDSRCER